MIKYLFAGLLIAIIAGCASMTPEQSCTLIHGSAATAAAAITQGQQSSDEAREIVAGVSAAVDLASMAVTDTMALEILQLIQCAIEGVGEGLEQ